jgi:hypothetical protein
MHAVLQHQQRRDSFAVGTGDVGRQVVAHHDDLAGMRTA